MPRKPSAAEAKSIWDLWIMFCVTNCEQSIQNSTAQAIAQSVNGPLIITSSGRQIRRSLHRHCARHHSDRSQSCYVRPQLPDEFAKLYKTRISPLELGERLGHEKRSTRAVRNAHTYKSKNLLNSHHRADAQAHLAFCVHDRKPCALSLVAIETKRR